MKERLRGGMIERVARGLYQRARGVAPAAGWYEDSDERSKFTHILEAVNYIRVTGLPPVFFEFGCHSGRTFSAAVLAARFFGMSLDAYAFDSFEGLPDNDEDRTGMFAGGSFRSDIRAFKAAVRARTGHSVPDDHIVPGFFDISLTEAVSRRLPPWVGFVHVDVDLYRSTVPVLEFVKGKLVEGSVLMFDDWFCFPAGKEQGERRALDEFRQRNPGFGFEDWKNYSAFGKSLFVVSTSDRK